MAWSEGRRPLGAVLYSPDEQANSRHDLRHDDSTVKIVVAIIIIIIITGNHT